MKRVLHLLIALVGGSLIGTALATWTFVETRSDRVTAATMLVFGTAITLFGLLGTRGP